MIKKYQINFNKLPTQARLFDNDETMDIMFAGGLGSGKTFVLCNKVLKLSNQNRHFSGGLLAPSFPDLRRDIIPTFEEILDQNNIPYKYHKSEKWFNFPWQHPRAKVYLFSAEKPIAGPNLAYCGINEFSLIPYDRITEMLRRVRVKEAPVKQRIMVGTPEDVHGWLEDFVEKRQKQNDGRFLLLNARTDENIHIDDNYGMDLEGMLDAQSLKVFREGQIVRIGGNYFYYSFNKLNNVSDKVEFDPNRVIHVGLDFNVGYMTASLGQKWGGEFHFFDEVLLQGDANTYTMARVLTTHPQYDHKRMIITCDASGASRRSSSLEQVQSDVAILRKHGLEVRFKTQNPRLRSRQVTMNSHFDHKRIWIHPRCKLLIKDFEKTLQKSDFTKDEGKEKKFGHFSDGADYVIEFELPLDLNRNKIVTYSEKR
jgi:hypothetical protein